MTLKYDGNNSTIFKWNTYIVQNIICKYIYAYLQKLVLNQIFTVLFSYFFILLFSYIYLFCHNIVVKILTAVFRDLFS